MSEPGAPLRCVFTLFDSPPDFPGRFVLCRYDLRGERLVAGDELVTAADADTLRALMLARGLVCVPRDVDDAPELVETWL